MGDRDVSRLFYEGAERALQLAASSLVKGLKSFEDRDYIAALNLFQASSEYAARAVLIAYGLHYPADLPGVGSFLSRNKNHFPEWFAAEADAIGKVVDRLAEDRPKVAVFLVSQPMWYSYEHSLEEYEALAIKVLPKVHETVQSCMQLVQQRLTNGEHGSQNGTTNSQS